MSSQHTQTTQQPGDVFFLTILGSIASDRQTSRPHTDNIPGISKLYPGYIQAASKLHPGCIQTTSRLHPHPGNIKATSRKYSGYIQATFRLNPGYIQATSRLHPGVITGVAERRIAERRLSFPVFLLSLKSVVFSAESVVLRERCYLHLKWYGVKNDMFH